MSYTNLLYHIVFRPYASRPVITEAYEKELYAYIYGICRAKQCKLYRIGGMPDHIHMLVSIVPSLALSDFVREIKISSNRFMKENPAKFPNSQKWADWYCAITYSLREKETVCNYIKNQKEHHKKVGFKDELRQLCIANGISVDELYFLKE